MSKDWAPCDEAVPPQHDNSDWIPLDEVAPPPKKWNHIDDLFPQADNGDEWPPLGSSPTPPTFPVDVLPPVLCDWIQATAIATQTPVDLAACAALGVLSACVAGTAVVDVAPGWQEEVCLYILCALESGDRKSAVLRAATAPLRAIERRWVAEAGPDVARARSLREATQQRRKTLMSRAAKTDDDDAREQLARQAGDLAAQMDAEGEPHVPRLLADDATPEALAGLLAQHGRMAILAAESAFLDNLAGRYAEGRSNLHLVCQAFTGEPTTVDRRGRDPEMLKRPLLTMALAIQPHVLAALVADPAARDQGLVARCLLAQPKSLMGIRQADPPPVAPALTDAWTQLVERLAQPLRQSRQNGHNSRGSVGCVGSVVGVRAEALALLYRLHNDHEHRIAEDGDLRPIASWWNRHAGRAIRVAALLHLAGDKPGKDITADTMERALRIGDWSLAHARDALTGPPVAVTSAARWLERRRESTVSIRDLHKSRFGAKGKVAQAKQLADDLVAHGYLRGPLTPPPVGSQGGRPPSPRYAVHPELCSNAAPLASNGDGYVTDDEELF